MKENLVNSHFIQKAYAKNFAVDNKIYWERYKTDESGVFNIKNTKNKYQPITKFGFYSQKVEDGMNEIEQDGIILIGRINEEVHANNKKITLTRSELYKLKYFSLISSARTEKFRKNMENLDGDLVFNNLVRQSSLSPKQMQEEILLVYIKKYKDFKNNPTLEGAKDSSFYTEYNEVASFTKMRFFETFQSRAVIMHFDQPKLILTESLCFTESNPSTGGILLHFMPISADVGIAFYFDTMVLRGRPSVSSKIFKNDIANIKNRNKYANKTKIEKALLKYIKKHAKNGEDLEKVQKMFNLTEIYKYYTKKDLFFYRVLKEPSLTSDICNAMSLVHNVDSIHIYQDKSHINDAEEQVKKLGIHRIENMWK